VYLEEEHLTLAYGRDGVRVEVVPGVVAIVKLARVEVSTFSVSVSVQERNNNGKGNYYTVLELHTGQVELPSKYTRLEFVNRMVSAGYVATNAYYRQRYHDNVPQFRNLPHREE